MELLGQPRRRGKKNARKLDERSPDFCIHRRGWTKMLEVRLMTDNDFLNFEEIIEMLKHVCRPLGSVERTEFAMLMQIMI